MLSDLLLELLVNGVQRIFDGNTLQVPRCYLQAEGEVQVNLLDRRSGEHLLQRFFVI